MYHTHSKCLKTHHPFEKVIIGWSYTEIGKRILSIYKYYGAYRISKLLYRLITEEKILDKLLNTTETILITSIPLHPQRERHRGFNQSTLVANLLANNSAFKANIVFVRDLLVRTKNNPHQASLSKKARKRNVYEIFEINNVYKNITNDKAIDAILLVDDVLTTGATINTAGKCLRSQYPKTKLYAFCLFRGRPYYKKSEKL